MTEELGISGAKKFEKAKQYLLPNEDIRLVCQTRTGFLVLSSRRVVLLKEESLSEFRIERAIPYDCILRFEPKRKNCFTMTGVVLDSFGCHTQKTASLELETPRGDKGETKAKVGSRFQTTMNQCKEKLEEIRQSNEFTYHKPSTLDYSYLQRMPESLTQNAILDLNTILRDQPVHDELIHEALKFLGPEPFLLEESLRDGRDKESGVLFAAGTKGYYWIQGMKHSRFMSNVIVNTVEWENIRCFVHQWHHESGIINATYSLTKDGNETTIEYLWSPSTYGDSHKYAWLLQQLNGPWIIADVSSKYSGKSVPASWDGRTPLGQPELHKPRYYH
ncbi:MAG: hypothetical protein ACXAAO_09120 [Candidatus Thorarchaeota archaeon]|jgi:hypothetical protein